MLTNTVARKIPIIISGETPSSSSNVNSQDYIDLCQDSDYDDDFKGNSTPNKRVLDTDSNGTLNSGTKFPRYIDLINDDEYDTITLNFTQTSTA